MILQELLKNKVDIITENDILSDVIYATDSVERLLAVLQDKIKKAKDPSDFLIVYIVKENKPAVMITYREIDKLLEKLGTISLTAKVADLELEKLFPLNQDFVVKKDALVEQVLNILRRRETDVVIVENEDREYSGKIRRARLAEKLRQLIS